MHPGIPIALVFIGCCSNVVFLEGITKAYPDSGNMLTFSAFVFNCLEGLFITTRFLTRPSVIPLRYYTLMVSFFFVAQTLNNYTLGFNISMPLHMIFRAGSLITNLFLGVLILNKQYKPSKYFSVALITLGIAVCTITSATSKDAIVSRTGDEAYDYFIWLIGLGLLIVSLMVSASMGIFQEKTYAKYGKHPSEALFYNHFLPLPGFLFLASDISRSISEFSASAPYTLPVLNAAVPWAWLWLLFNTLTQFLCIKSVFILTTECASLTVTLVVTLRKFVSLVFSILYFRNPFTPMHWVGATLVFVGTLMFVEVFHRLEAFRKLEAKFMKTTQTKEKEERKVQ